MHQRQRHPAAQQQQQHCNNRLSYCSIAARAPALRDCASDALPPPASIIAPASCASIIHLPALSFSQHAYIYQRRAPLHARADAVLPPRARIDPAVCCAALPPAVIIAIINLPAALQLHCSSAAGSTATTAFIVTYCVYYLRAYRSTAIFIASNCELPTVIVLQLLRLIVLYKLELQSNVIVSCRRLQHCSANCQFKQRQH